MSDLFATKLYADCAFNLAENNVVRDATTCFVIVDNLRFFADFLEKKNAIKKIEL